MKYIERQSGDTSTPTHWIYGVSTTTLSERDEDIGAGRISTEPKLGTTPAVYFQGVWYYFDREES